MAANGSDEAYDERSIRFAFDRDFAPFTYEEDGSLRGFELDSPPALGRRWGFRADPRSEAVWTEAKLSFQRGEVDVIGGLVKTEERLEEYSFTDHPHGTFDILTFVRDDGDIRSADMLRGRRAAVQNGSISFDL